MSGLRTGAPGSTARLSAGPGRQLHPRIRRIAEAAAQNAPLAMRTQQDFEQFLTRHVATIAPLQQQTCEAWWKANTTGKPEYEKESARLEAAFRKLYANRDEYAALRSLLSAKTLKDPHLARQAHLLSHAYLGNQMEPARIEAMVALEKEVESDFNNHRATVGNDTLTDNDIKDILRHDTSSARRKAAWEGSKQIGAKVADRVLRLVRMRNENARELGFRDYYAMSLELQDLDETRLFDVLAQLAKLTDPLWRSFKKKLDTQLATRYKTKTEDLRPWHYSDPFFQELPKTESFDLDRFFAGKNLEHITRDFYAAIGLDVDDILRRSDLYEREGKCQHAFCICIDRADDVRVLCNNKSDEYWMSTMLHEFGHAVYDKYIDRKLPYLLREPAHILFTEAVAMFMGRLTKDAAWLERYAGVPRQEAEQAAAALRGQQRDQLLVFVRWGLVVANFERAMYRNPEQDLNKLWWDLVERYQKVIRPARRNRPDWASKIHLATAPVYYQNYVLGEMVASQMLHALHSKIVSGDGHKLISDHKVGRWFVDHIFKPGTSQHWEDILAAASGERLNPAYLAEFLRESPVRAR
jgi:peptidyl-dipeptidase A